MGAKLRKLRVTLIWDGCVLHIAIMFVSSAGCSGLGKVNWDSCEVKFGEHTRRAISMGRPELDANLGITNKYSLAPFPND